LSVLQQAIPNGAELDAFDLVAHVAFDQKPLTRRERANNVKKRDVFGQYGEQARAVLEALLDKFADHGVQDIEDAKVLELPPFDQFGSKTQIRRGIFGGVDQYIQAVQALEQALYDAEDNKKQA
jgi:type I restriction enzyme R subunit